MKRLTFFLHLVWLIIIVVAMPSLFSFVLLPSVHAVTFYKWVDKNGVVNFTDDLEKVPSQYRNQAERVEQDTSSAESPTSVQSPSQSSKEVGETKKDIYGMGETWWRQKAQVWNEQLKDATAKLETVNNKIIEKSDSIRNPIQNRMNIVELEKLEEERSKYQAQVDEAKEMLKKLAKEAEDAKADPQWIK